MNKKMILVSFLVTIGALLAAPAFLQAQSSGIIGARYTGTGDPMKPVVKFDLEPVLTVNLKEEVIEILPGGTNVLYTAPHRSEWRVGANEAWGIALGDKSEGISVYYSSELLQLDDKGIVLKLQINDGKTKAVLSSQNLSLQNYQEAILEFATSSTGNRRLAVRLLPAVQVKEALRGYPGLVEFFGIQSPGGYLILNGREVVSRGGGGITMDKLDGSEQQFLAIRGRTGLLVVSYRPFPGAAIKGYFENRKMMIDYNGDVYEWASLSNLFLPEGKWAAYVWQADSTPSEKPNLIIFASSVNELPGRIEKILNSVKKHE